MSSTSATIQGGLLDQAVSVTSALMPRGEVDLDPRSHPGRDAALSARAAATSPKGKPLVVLINGGSAVGIRDRGRRASRPQARHS